MARDEFLEVVKSALAKRASYLCSAPDCRCLTIAPAESDAMSFLFIGKAAHICAASAGGPRFDPTMTSDQRKSIDNAIFLCSSCADMIDRNGGSDFSVDLLKKWKSEHEPWVRANLNRKPGVSISEIAGSHSAHGIGEVTGLDIQGPVIIKPGTIVTASGQGLITGTRIGSPRKG